MSISKSTLSEGVKGDTELPWTAKNKRWKLVVNHYYQIIKFCNFLRLLTNWRSPKLTWRPPPPALKFSPKSSFCRAYVKYSMLDIFFQRSGFGHSGWNPQLSETQNVRKQNWPTPNVRTNPTYLQTNQLPGDALYLKRTKRGRTLLSCKFKGWSYRCSIYGLLLLLFVKVSINVVTSHVYFGQTSNSDRQTNIWRNTTSEGQRNRIF